MENQPMLRAGQQKRVADRDTPFVFNSWYVAAWSDEVGRTLLRRDLLGRPIVLYRTAERRVVALHDRCPHRSMPLSRGMLDGDTLVCGYHGLAFDPKGACIRVPSQQAPARGIAVRCYPVAERTPYVWVWMGDAAKADPSLIPEAPWASSPDWTYVHGYSHIRCNYIRLHENLLDLSHFTYLHANNVGTPAYAGAPFDVEVHGDRVQIVRTLADSPVPPLYGWPMGIDGKHVDRSSDSWFVAPGFNLTHARIVDRAPGAGARAEYKVEVLHAITPESRTSCHYFWAQARDFSLGDHGVNRFTIDQLMLAFKEDADALEWIEETYDRDGTPDFAEMSVGADRPGLEMRRIMQRLADAEAAKEREAAA